VGPEGTLVTNLSLPQLLIRTVRWLGNLVSMSLGQTNSIVSGSPSCRAYFTTIIKHRMIDIDLDLEIRSIKCSNSLVVRGKSLINFISDFAYSCYLL
jgi:hypothetical protein